MPKYVIEREIPGAGKLSPQELKAISQKSCGVLSKLGPQIQSLRVQFPAPWGAHFAVVFGFDTPRLAAGLFIGSKVT